MEGTEAMATAKLQPQKWILQQVAPPYPMPQLLPP